MSETQTAAVAERPQVSGGEPILSIKHLSKDFRLRGGRLFSKPQVLHALSDVSLDVYPGETLGIIGESGCGKSTLGRCVVQLHQATSGQIVYGGQDINKLAGQELKAVRKDIQMIFQDSYSSLDPRYTAAKTIEEPMLIYRTESDASKREQRVLEVMREVGLDVQHLQRYPHEFSGGQRQRINVARALVLDPKVIVCDEPVSALDVSIQAQVLNLLKDLQKQYGTAYLFIAHDLSVVQHISDRVAVMYLGNMMEVSDWKSLYAEPNHPYTQSLLSAVPIPDPDVQHSRKRIILKGDPPSPINPPSGCRFHTRCPIAQAICSQERPELREVAPGHFCACHFAADHPIKGSSIEL